MTVVVVCGAGATRSEASRAASTKQPPLDRGFFRLAKKAKSPEFTSVAAYLQNIYGTDITCEKDDSLERVMGVLYSDLQNPAIDDAKPAEAFRNLLRLVNRRISETTNEIVIGKKSCLYRILRHLVVKRKIAASDLSVLTFNYDLSAERTLFELNGSTSIPKHQRPLVTFPDCYQLPKVRTSAPPNSVQIFRSQYKRRKGIPVLKLHGSLNWFFMHDVPHPDPKDLLDRSRELWVTPRRKTLLDMTMTFNKKKRYTFPLVVPPVVNKAAILHESLKPIWERAFDCLNVATEVIVFGYSCPEIDQESANLFSRSLRTNSVLRRLSVIDPSVAALARFATLSNYSALQYYRDAKSYLSHVNMDC